METISILDSGGAICVPPEVGAELVRRRLIAKCDGFCGGSDEDGEECGHYHLRWSVLEGEHGVEFAGDDVGGWNVVDSVIEEVTGMAVEPRGLPFDFLTVKTLVTVAPSGAAA